MTDELLPRTDLAVAQINALSDLAPTIMPAGKAVDEKSRQYDYPQIIVQLPQKVDLLRYKNIEVGKYTTHIDFYIDLSKQGDLADMLDKAENKLKRLVLSKYPIRYVRGSCQTPQPIADNTTSRPLWHGVILIDYEIKEIY